MTSENNLTGLSVTFEHTLVDSYYSTEEYGDWREEYYNFFKSAKVITEHPDVVTTLPLKPDDEVYIVWAEWDTGDSFGCSKCNSYEVIGVFRDLDAAEELERFLWDSEHYHNINGYGYVNKERAEKNISEIKLPHNVTYEYVKNKIDNGSMHTTLHTSDGQQFKFNYFPWCGYFDKLSNVQVENTTLL